MLYSILSNSSYTIKFILCCLRKLFTIYCILFIHVNVIYIMYIFIKSTYCSYYVAIQKWVSGFGYPRVSVLGMDFDPKRCSGRVRVLSLGFGFGHICHFTQDK